MVAVGVAAARGVQDPAEQNGDQDEGDESAGQRPEHTAKHIGRAREPARARFDRRAARRVRLRVQGDLLVGRGERPRDLEPSLLTEHEPQLAGWAQPLRVVGTEGRARAAVRHRAQEVLTEITTLAAGSCCPFSRIRHNRPRPRTSRLAQRPTQPSKRIFHPPCNDDSRKTQELHMSRYPCKLRESFRVDGLVPHFP